MRDPFVSETSQSQVTQDTLPPPTVAVPAYHARHRPSVAEVARLTAWVSDIESATLSGADQALRQGLRPVPTMHLFDHTAAHPYLGAVVCRRFERGRDAAAAITAMGSAAAAAGATRLLAAWEHAALHTAFALPGGLAPAGMVVLDAHRGVPGHRPRHGVTWYPYRIRLGPPATGARRVHPCWQTPARYPGMPLCEPVVALLARWRDPIADTIDTTDTAAGQGSAHRVLERLALEGYTICWTEPRRIGAEQPAIISRPAAGPARSAAR